MHSVPTCLSKGAPQWILVCGQGKPHGNDPDHKGDQANDGVCLPLLPPLLTLARGGSRNGSGSRSEGGEWKRERGRDWQTPWRPHLPEALYWAPSHRANREWDGLAQLGECLESPRRCNQRETSPPVFAWKWDLGAAASTLGSRAQGDTKALWDDWEEKDLRAGGWEQGAGDWEEKAVAPVRRRPLHRMERGSSNQTMQQHSLPSFSGNLQREVKGIPGGGRLGRGPLPLPLPLPLPFFVIVSLTFPARKSIFLSFRVAGRATNEIAGNPDQLWPAPPALQTLQNMHLILHSSTIVKVTMSISAKPKGGFHCKILHTLKWGTHVWQGRGTSCCEHQAHPHLFIKSKMGEEKEAQAPAQNFETRENNSISKWQVTCWSPDSNLGDLGGCHPQKRAFWREGFCPTC